jgi:VWFA-related protein
MKSFKAINAVVLLLTCASGGLAQTAAKPLSVAFLVDVSASQERTITRTTKAARKSVVTLLSSPDDRAGVVTFARSPSSKQPLTSDLKQIDSALQAVRFEPPPGYVGGGVVVGNVPVTRHALALSGTLVWDAIWFTFETVFIQPAKERSQAVILITDGEDTNSQRKIEDIIARAATLNIGVYAIGVGEKRWVSRNESTLRKLSDRTGGKAFFPRSEKEMMDAMAQIEHHLRAR